jgi:hypothetical protein
MKHTATVVALTCAILAGRAFAVDSTSQARPSKHQSVARMVDCMKKRMSADKSSSYHDAMKACQDQIDRQNGNLPSGALVAADISAKP